MIDKTEIDSSALKSPWVWGWIGMIVIVLLANITMIHFARSTSPGLVVDDYYEKGKNYDDTLKERQREKELGWQIVPQLPKRIIAGQAFSLALSIADARGDAFLPDSATIYLFRPSDATADFSMPVKIKESAMLDAELVLPLPGRWDIIFSFSKGGKNKELPYKVFVEKAGQS